MMKDALHNYLKKYFEYWEKETGALPMVPYDEDFETSMYHGKVDEEEYIQWKFIKNNNLIDFSEIEEKYGILLLNEIKEFYSSYFFLQLEGFLNGKNIWIEPITDCSNILHELEYVFTNEGKELIQIGICRTDDLPVCFSNISGKVVEYDYERDKREVLSSSLEEFFTKLTPDRR